MFFVDASLFANKIFKKLENLEFRVVKPPDEKEKYPGVCLIFKTKMKEVIAHISHTLTKLGMDFVDGTAPPKKSDITVSCFRFYTN